MGQGGAIATVFIMFIAIIALGASYFYIATRPAAQKTVFCREDDGSLELSFVINDDDRSVLMAGQPVNPNHVKIFNKSAFEISWQSESGSQTQMFMDRIAGKLEVETRSNSLSDWRKVKLNCNHQAARF